VEEIRKVAILGIGLIGGSLALAWKHARPEIRVTGFASPDTLEKAVRRGAIDYKAESLEDAVREADLVVLATPVLHILSAIPKISQSVKPGAIVTDVGSVKSAITRSASRHLPASVYFIGGHPMAGSEQQGIEAADPFLFQNAVYVLSPTPSTPDAVLSRFVALLESTGAQILLLDADIHDRIAAFVSHFPQILAVTLMNMVGDQNESDPRLFQLAAGGFRDLTRIASSPFSIWSDVLETNKGHIDEVIDTFVKMLEGYRKSLDRESIQVIDKAFQRARRLRDSIPRDTKGFLRPLVDVFIYVEDRPGVISEISTALFRENINIKDIELLKIREGAGGTFRLSFDDAAVADRAIVILNSVGHKAFRK